ncbi:MAG: hypothetical protein IK127_00200 [Clostridia bacterium]|nr:hypothetical protein [Clostridia bacterium]
MSEQEKEVSMPKKLWNSALKTVKGDSTQTLVENFTAEMTLVAEGLCEDQAKLRAQVENLESGQDRSRQRFDSEVEALETSLREQQKEMDGKLDALTDRIAAVERTLDKTVLKKKKGIAGWGWLAQLTLLAAIICGAWVLVTLMNTIVK